MAVVKNEHKQKGSNLKKELIKVEPKHKKGASKIKAEVVEKHIVKQEQPPPRRRKSSKQPDEHPPAKSSKVGLPAGIEEHPQAAGGDRGQPLLDAPFLEGRSLEWQQDFLQQYGAEVLKPDLEEKAVRGDGNCLFRAVGWLLGHGVEAHMDFRRRAVDAVQANYEHFLPLVEATSVWRAFLLDQSCAKKQTASSSKPCRENEAALTEALHVAA